MLDGDELEGGARARLQVARNGVEVSAPPALADSLHHLHRCNGIELIRGVPVILQPDLDLVRESRLRDLLVGPCLLLAGKRKAYDGCASLGRLDGERAPAAADLQQPV